MDEMVDTLVFITDRMCSPMSTGNSALKMAATAVGKSADSTDSTANMHTKQNTRASSLRSNRTSTHR